MNILVIGASSGIGEAVARYQYKQGNAVILVARREDRLSAIAGEMKNTGSGEVYICPADVTKSEDVESIFEYIFEKEIKLDGMVFCAGINRDIPIKSIDSDDMQDVMNTNVMSFINLCKFFAKKKYSNNGASVVAISSLASKSAVTAMCTYSASKAALNSAVRVFAKEMLSRKIRANAILPGFVDTDMAKEASEKYGDVAKNQPLGIIEPEQIAYAVEFLLSDKSKYITGSLLEINGGDF